MNEAVSRIGCGVGDGASLPESSILRRQSPGFTLLEVLLAMAILAVIMTVIYTSFSSSGRNVEQAEALRDEADLARALITRLSTDIANAYVKGPSILFYAVAEEVLTEKGKAEEKIRHDKINLTTLTNWRKPDSKEMELWEVGYFFKEKSEGNGYSLYRREKRELGKEPPLEGGEEYEITDRVESLQLKYFNGVNWVDGWNIGNTNLPQATNLPIAVEITVILDSGKVYTTKVDILNKV